MFTSQDFKILGLDFREKKIIDALNKTPFSSSGLSRVIALPRTTVIFLLNNLEKRGLIEKTQNNRRFLWKLKNKKDLAYILRNISNHIDPFSDYFLFDKKDGQESKVEIFYGKEKMRKALCKIIKLGKGERFYGIQGSKSLEKSFDKISWKFIFDYHQKIKEKGIIIEGVISKKSLQIFNSMSKKELKSHLGRLSVAYLASDEFFDFKVDIIIFKNNVVIVNYEDEIVLFIKNDKITEAIKKIVLFIESFSQKIDLNKYIKNLIYN